MELEKMKERREELQERLQEKIKEGQERFEVKIRKYSERGARLERTNRITTISMTIVEGALAALYGMMLLSHTGKLSVGMPAVILLSAGLIMNWVVFLRNKESASLRYILLVPFLIVYAWLNIMAESNVTMLYILPPAYCYITYYDKKCSRILALSGAGVVFVKLVMLLTGSAYGSTNDGVMGCLITILSLFYAYFATLIVKQYDHDSVHTMRDEQKYQKLMIDDILTIIEITQEKVQDVAQVMEELKSSTEIVNYSLQEIAVGTQSTAESIQEQTVMTESINKAVENADKNSIEMASEAENSVMNMDKSSARMKEMEEQSLEIETAGKNAADAMEQLKQKVEEVSGITQVIFSISSQTNLLALNASIESARAGEAGRGFAVVADQIRQLAEQTKVSTEQIAAIAGQLNADADRAAELLGKSVAASEEQKKLITENAQTFAEVKQCADETSDRAKELNNEIGRLLGANNKIVESITQLSAVSEEVTASTQQASRLSENNMCSLADAAAKVEDIRNTVMQLQKYQRKNTIGSV